MRIFFTPRLPTGVDTTLHWVLSGNMASEAQRSSHQIRHARQATSQGTKTKGKTRHDTAGRTCVKARRGRAGLRPTTLREAGVPHGKWLRSNACQRKEHQANQIQAQHASPTCDKPTQADDHNQNSSTTQDNTSTTHNKRKEAKKNLFEPNARGEQTSPQEFSIAS